MSKNKFIFEYDEEIKPTKLEIAECDTNEDLDEESDSPVISNGTIILDEVDGKRWMNKLPEKYRIKLKNEFDEWIKTKKSYNITTEQLKEQLIKDLTFLSSLSVTEYTLYKKWDEIHRKYNINKGSYSANLVNNLLGGELTPEKNIEITFKETLEVKKNIWVPQHVDDYKKLEPNIIYCDCPEKLEIWNTLRTFTHTQINNSNIGRNLYFIVEDNVTKKYLGVIAVSSDFLDLTPRDEYIGWSREVKTQNRMINHTAIGSTICPTQPLGFNYVGGKLMALLTLSDVIENKWNSVYNTPEMPSKLVGMTTTSLYSSFSQYQNLKYWSKKGHSSGSIKFEPHEKTMKMVKQYLETYHDVKYWEWYIATEPGGMPLKRDYKQRSLSFLYGKLGIDKSLTQSNHTRGIYFCDYYDNMKQFLRKEIPESELVRRKDFDNSVEALTNLWKEKYASKRVKSLEESGRLNLSEFLFYDDLIVTDWEDTLKKYSKEVGR